MAWEVKEDNEELKKGPNVKRVIYAVVDDKDLETKGFEFELEGNMNDHFNTDNKVCFYKHVKSFDKFYKLEASSYRATLNKYGDAELEDYALKSPALLEKVDNTMKINCEIDRFFNNLAKYAEYDIDPKRAILLYSEPGMGKTTTITSACTNFIKENDTAVIFWNTGKVDADEFNYFFNAEVQVDENVKRIIIVMEDIGGGNSESGGGPRAVDAGLLNFLDGNGIPFPVPTFIIATTNYPQNLLGALADRPGRFDKFIELSPPSLEDRIALLEFIKKDKASDDELRAMELSEGFSMAHIKEIFIRSEIEQKSATSIVKELRDHKKNFDNGFDGKKKTTTGLI